MIVAKFSAIRNEMILFTYNLLIKYELKKIGINITMIIKIFLKNFKSS